MKYFKKLLLITLLSVFSLPTLGKKPDFSGEWYYHTTNDSREYMGNFIFKQRGNMIVGEWAEGSPQGMGDTGKLKGIIKGNKLYVRYCNTNSDWRSICPNYDKEEEYFIFKDKKLVRYKLVGEKYIKSDTLTK